jgi:hypothetical protein
VDPLTIVIAFVQDLVRQARVIRYRRERWLMPNGRMLVAPPRRNRYRPIG